MSADPLWKSKAIRTGVLGVLGAVALMGADIVRGHGSAIADMQQRQAAEQAWREATTKQLDEIAREVHDFSNRK